MNRQPSLGRPLRWGALAVLALGGLTACGSPGATPAGTADGRPATAAPAGAVATTSPGAPGATSAPAPSGEAGAGVTPVRLRLGALGIDAPVLGGGLNGDGTVAVPSLDRIGEVYWYEGSARPGESGRAVLLGHVDGHGKPGVFVALRDARPGAEATIVGADGRTVRYRITAVETHLKSRFPTELVYGESTAHELRLITCGGQFDRAAGSYESNIIAFGTQIEETH